MKDQGLRSNGSDASQLSMRPAQVVSTPTATAAIAVRSNGTSLCKLRRVWLPRSPAGCDGTSAYGTTFAPHELSLRRGQRTRTKHQRRRRPHQPRFTVALPACSKGAIGCRDASPMFRHLHKNRASRHELASGPDGASRYSCPTYSYLVPKG